MLYLEWLIVVLKRKDGYMEESAVRMKAYAVAFDESARDNRENDAESGGPAAASKQASRKRPSTSSLPPTPSSRAV